MAEQGGKTAASFYDNVKRMAEELGLEGDERESFINQAMEKKGGHKKVTTWIPDDGKGGDGNTKSDGGWFS